MKKFLLVLLALVMAVGLAMAESDEKPMPAEAAVYEGEWACDRAVAELVWEEEGFRVLISWGSSAWENTTWEYSCYYQEGDNTLVSVPFGIKTDLVFDDNGNETSATVAYEDGQATFKIDEDGHLIWIDEKENAGDGMHFVKLDGSEIGVYTDEVPEALKYVSAWVAENGDWRIEVYDEDGGLKLMVVHLLDGKEDIWEYAALLGEDGALTAVPLGLHYRQDISTGNWDETYYEDGDATFTIDADGKLLWADAKEDAGKGLAFEKIGSFYGGRWMKGDIEVIFYAWYDGEYDVRMYKLGENGEILQDAIAKGPYDAATDTLTVDGYFDPDVPFTVTFSFTDEGLVWTENGESTVLEYSYNVD